MSTEDISREKWATRIGFILAAVGSAVGLGNVWRFPFQVGEQGGAAFIVVYLLFVVLIGLPAILVEFVLGRRSERNPINAFERIGHGNWKFIGGIGVITGFLILSFYTVAAGWVTRYTFASLTGGYFDDPGGYFVTIAAGYEAVAFHLVFLALTAGIVALGIQRGIELTVKLMVPAIIALFVVLAVYASTLDGAGAGLEYYLSPEWGALSSNWQTILPAAAGQAFFTLSLGMGVMITYASYLGEDRNLVKDSGWIAFLDTGIAILSGLVVFPILFTIDILPEEPGAGALFVGVGQAIAEVPFSSVVGFVFFGTVAIAALSSAISILEVLVSFLIDNFGIERRSATFGSAFVIFLLGIPSALDTDFLTLVDNLTAQLLLPLGVFLLVVFVGWVYEDSTAELAKGIARSPEDLLPQLWVWHVRIVLLGVMAVVLFLELTDLLGI